MRSARRSRSLLKLLAGVLAGSLLATLVVVSPAYATISGQSATNDATTVSYQFTYTGAPQYARVYIDTDRSAATGFAQNGVGADYLLENGSLYHHNGGGSGDVSYVASSDNFANPERGLYHHTGDCDKTDFSAATLQSYRTSQGISLVMCVFYLAEYKNSAIAQSALDQLQQQLDTVRAAGLKMILRFAYTTSTTGDDAPLTRVQSHLDQLAPYLSSNKDVIAVLQAGFIGAWGEWYYTQNFGNAGVISATDLANRKAVTDKLLSVLPSDRMIQVRTPKIKRTMYSTSPVTSGQAYNGSALSRLGHHNDCFLASPDDFGTYENTSVEYPYLQSETNYVPMGGETCASNPPRSSCPTALSELAQFHWSYLNTDYEPTVLNSWSTGGCLADVTKRLGYRFTLQTGTYPTTATRGGSLPISITLQNNGFSTPYNPHGVELVLRNTSTGAIQRLALNTDPRRWSPGSTTTISQTLTVPPSLPTGTYALLLNLPDPQLSSRPEYSVRFANQSTWEAATGLNSLLRTITVS